MKNFGFKMPTDEEIRQMIREEKRLARIRQAGKVFGVLLSVAFLSAILFWAALLISLAWNLGYNLALRILS